MKHRFENSNSGVSPSPPYIMKEARGAEAEPSRLEFRSRSLLLFCQELLIILTDARQLSSCVWMWHSFVLSVGFKMEFIQMALWKCHCKRPFPTEKKYSNDCIFVLRGTFNMYCIACPLETNDKAAGILSLIKRWRSLSPRSSPDFGSQMHVPNPNCKA